MNQHLQSMIGTMQQELKNLASAVSAMVPKAEDKLERMKDDFWGDFKNRYERERAELMVSIKLVKVDLLATMEDNVRKMIGRYKGDLNLDNLAE